MATPSGPKTLVCGGLLRATPAAAGPEASRASAVSAAPAPLTVRMARLSPVTRRIARHWRARAVSHASRYAATRRAASCSTTSRSAWAPAPGPTIPATRQPLACGAREPRLPVRGDGAGCLVLHDEPIRVGAGPRDHHPGDQADDHQDHQDLDQG